MSRLVLSPLASRLILWTLLLATLVACSNPSGQNGAAHTLTGTLTLQAGSYNNSNVDPSGKTCSPWGQYQDLQAGLDVVISDEVGKIVGSTVLGTGTSPKTYFCVFPFIATVGDAQFYSIQIGQRPAKVIPRSELETNNWLLDLSITQP